ncbi:DUF559 domain-containing protein [Nesterenkonia sp. MY13]|uniref:DUF559 domain-containing protein n=1 Tax=Nesterenkonia sedimenti TaxID=1463632 RepID=A0A7X8THQ4_9MICC|nr:DUF559 domain-containing protein [Nesterenkonia sedimenti]NLS08794.1 DUF559 domain-containing protein [Nesterenkonia sedimenti]
MTVDAFLRQCTDIRKELVSPAAFRGFGTRYVTPLPRLSFADGVVALDAALRGTDQHSPVSTELLQSLASELMGSRPARFRWEKAFNTASPLSESPGESWARALYEELGFRTPKLQVSLTTEGKRYRVDFLWEEAGVVGEFDGWMKYQTEGREALRAEKLREDAIRSLGFTVLRIYWEDLQNPEQLRRKLQRAGVPTQSS